MTKLEKIGRICEEVKRLDGDEVFENMVFRSFSWSTACRVYPRMTAEEIASMAASTYEWVHL